MVGEVFFFFIILFWDWETRGGKDWEKATGWMKGNGQAERTKWELSSCRIVGGILPLTKVATGSHLSK